MRLLTGNTENKQIMSVENFISPRSRADLEQKLWKQQQYPPLNDRDNNFKSGEETMFRVSNSSQAALSQNKRKSNLQ